MIKIENFYGIDLPKEDDYVVAKITNFIEGGGFFVNLLEYSNKEGFIGLKEVTTCRFRKLKGLVKIGSIEVMKVEKISGNNIDLSRKSLDPEKSNVAMSKYLAYKSIYNWLIAKTDLFPIDIINNYITSYIHTENFIENAKNIEVDTEYKQLHECIVKLIASKCVEEKIQSVEFSLMSLANHSVNYVNGYLDYIRNNFEVNIDVHNTRKSIFRISSKKKIKEDEFQSILENINKIDFRYEDSKREIENNQIINNIQPQVNIGIIGHVSHGKTTLIQSMTGIDTRRHKEEIKSNRTLKLGYTNMRIIQCKCNDKITYKTYDNCKCEKVDVSIIDCPGHNVLLSTMIAGAHLMDAALLLVAVNEKFPQIQTEEHLNVVSIVDRVNDIIVVQNKLDLAKRNEALSQKDEIQKYLADYNVKPENIIPISAQKDINIECVLENLFFLAQKIIRERQENKEQANGLIVRTFDINKPGDKDVKGLVIGGSVMNGKFVLQDKILIMPQKISGTIISIKSDKNNLSEAKSGGLIAIQTDINPIYCDTFIGSSFILEKDFKEENIVSIDKKIKIKYYPIHDSKLKKGQKININILAKDIECEVVKVSKENNKCTIQLSKSVYIFDKFNFVITRDKRLFGFGKEIFTELDKKTIEQYTISNTYDKMLDQFENEYKIKHAPKPKTILPLPKIAFANTFSTITNFGEYCNIIKTTPNTLGSFIYTEQGLKSWSVNAKSQLIIKGRMTDNVFMNNIIKFCGYKICNRCKSVNTQTLVDRGVKKLSCDDCSWSEPVKK